MFNFMILCGKEKIGKRKVFQIYGIYGKITEVMNQQITIKVSEQVWRRASVLAEQKHQKLTDVLEEWLEETVAEIRIEELSDEEVMALAESGFDEGQQQNFSLLLKENSEGNLNDSGKLKLAALMQFYETGLLRKSKALRVAVERGLIAPLAG